MKLRWVRAPGTVLDPNRPAGLMASTRNDLVEVARPPAIRCELAMDTEAAQVSRERLPTDPDSGDVAPSGPGRGRRSGRGARSGLRWSVVLAILAGGFAGGLARYGVTMLWPSGGLAFPWAIVAVNCGGAFVLGLLIVLIADVLRSSRLLRPLLGTGFCGAFTTFSTVVVAAAEMLAHGRAATAGLLIAASVVGGLAATAVGLATGRSIAAHRRIASTEVEDHVVVEDGDSVGGAGSP
jgi:fluoride exporter